MGARNIAQRVMQSVPAQQFVLESDASVVNLVLRDHTLEID